MAIDLTDLLIIGAAVGGGYLLAKKLGETSAAKAVTQPTSSSTTAIAPLVTIDPGIVVAPYPVYPTFTSSWMGPAFGVGINFGGGGRRHHRRR